MKACPSCQNQVPAEAHFCPRCNFQFSRVAGGFLPWWSSLGTGGQLVVVLVGLTGFGFLAGAFGSCVNLLGGFVPPEPPKAAAATPATKELSPETMEALKKLAANEDAAAPRLAWTQKITAQLFDESNGLNGITFSPDGEGGTTLAVTCERKDAQRARLLIQRFSQEAWFHGFIAIELSIHPSYPINAGAKPQMERFQRQTP